MSNRRILANRRRMLRHLEMKIMFPAVRQFLQWTNEKLQVGRLRTKRFTTTTANKIVDWDEIELRGNEILSPVVFDVLVYAGRKTFLKQIIQKQGFDPIGEAVVGWSAEHTALLVTGIVIETQKAIRDVVKWGLAEGLANQKINMVLRPIIGLQSRHALAVGREYTRLLDAGVSEARALKKMEAYANKLHRYRARLIARTEAGEASLQGIIQGYDQMGVRRLKRVEDPDCCDICNNVQGDVVDIDSAYGLLHPQCEGVWVAAAGERPQPYTIDATGRRQEKIPSLEEALKKLPKRHVAKVEKFSIDTSSMIYKDVPSFRGRDIAGYWQYADKSVHLNALHMREATVLHEVGHAVYSTGVVPYAQKPLWKTWYTKASTTLEMQYPSAYSLTNEVEFFAECYSHYYQKKYNMIDNVIKKWFDKTFKGG